MMLHSIRRTFFVLSMGLLGLAGSASAGVNFERMAPNFFVDGESFSEGGFTFTQNGNFGTVDSAAAFVLAVPPTGNATQFYSGLNDSGITLMNTDNDLFRLSGFDAGFIAPIFQEPGVSAGRIVVRATGAMGESILASWDLGLSGDDGGFAFLTFGAPADFLPFGHIRSAVFFACVYVDASCVNPAENLAQFALDNINVAVVPEPSSYALLVLGVAVLTSRRRQMSKQLASGELS